MLCLKDLQIGNDNSHITSNSQDDSLQQSCLGVGNSETRILRQQLTVIGTYWCNSNMSNIFIENYLFIIQIYYSMFRLHIVERERKSVRVYEQRHKETPTLTQLKHQLLTTFSKFAKLYIFKFRILLV